MRKIRQVSQLHHGERRKFGLDAAGMRALQTGTSGICNVRSILRFSLHQAARTPQPPKKRHFLGAGAFELAELLRWQFDLVPQVPECVLMTRRRPEMEQRN